MKMKLWSLKLWSLSLTMISTSLLAQQATNSPLVPPVETPAAAPAITATAPAVTPAPAAKPARKKAAVKKPKPAARKAAAPAAELKTIPLVAGPAVVAANHVNVRARAGLKGEVVARMTNGEPVTVIEEVKLKHSGAEEPSVWAKIVLPQKASVWVFASFVDPTNKTVIPKKLNLRGGPGENFGILGTLGHGDSVKEIETKGGWMKIEAATNAYAFMAAQYLTQEQTALVATTPTETTQVTEPPSAAAATNAPAAIEIQPAPSEPAAAPTPAEEPPPLRIVQREGIVRYTVSIQAPTLFELVSPDNHRPINYLFTTSTNLDLNRYKGLHIIVTGEEGLDERWRNTPIITIQRIQVLE
jgi:uncharacterized protein YgiM (DUF1202 family)